MPARPLRARDQRDATPSRRGRCSGVMVASQARMEPPRRSPALNRTSSPDVARPPVAGDRAGGSSSRWPGSAAPGCSRPPRPSAPGPSGPADPGRPLPGLPPQPLVEPGDPAAVAQRPQLVPLARRPAPPPHHQRGQPPPPPVLPGRHPLDIPRRQRPPPGHQDPRHHRPMGHDRASSSRPARARPRGCAPSRARRTAPRTPRTAAAAAPPARRGQLRRGSPPQPGHAGEDARPCARRKPAILLIHASSRACAARRGAESPLGGC